MSPPKSQINIKYCPIHPTTNVTDAVYPCAINQNCCRHGSAYGCCSLYRTKYYESWSLWIFICGIMLACYLLCWYCKKLEKTRQSVRVNTDTDPSRVPPCLRPVDAHNIDHLLETLILNYRRRLLTQNQSVHNADVCKDSNDTEPPPEYMAALGMPKPQENLENPRISSHESRQDYINDRECSTIIVMNDESVPSYEEAINRT